MTDENYTGVTTGTVATACSLAAIDAIIDSQDIVCVTVETPKKSLDILIDSCSKLSDTSACAVAHKNPYNDPDVTVNLAIVAHVELIDFKNEKVLNGLRRISKPGLRIYASCNDLPQVINGLGIAIVSTSKGLMTDKEARSLNVGGEVLCYIS